MAATTPALDWDKLFAEMPGMRACVSADPVYRVLAISDGFLPAVGATRAEIIGQSIFDICAGPQGNNPGHASIRESLDRVRQTGAGETLALTPIDIKGPKGYWARRYWEINNTPVHSMDGGLACIVLLARDVTDAMQAEEQLRAQEAFTRQILDSAIDHAIITTDPGGHITGWNAGAARVLGWDEYEVLGEPLDRIFLPEDIMAGQPEAERALALTEGGAPDGGWHVRKGGERFWATGQMTTLRDGKGRLIGYLKILRDQTEREHMARELALKVEALNFLNTTLEQRVTQKAAERDRIWHLSNDLMDVCDGQRRLTSVNGAWKAVLGWPQEEVLGRDFLDFVHAEDRAPTRAVLENAQQEHRPMWFEARFRHHAGHFCTMAWMVSPDKGRFYKVGRDVTQQRETESKLRQSQKMEALGQLTGGIAHDFNNLLATITGSLELVRRKVAAGQLEGLDRWTGMASGAAMRASGLVQRLLAFSRKQTLDLKPVDVSELTSGMEELLRRTLGENVAVTLDLHSRPCMARTDANQLENALLNLAINARDAMGGHGKLRITVMQADLETRGAVADMPPGSYACLSVEDDGPGMPAEVLNRAFDPFFTTKPAGQGTGLGLSMIYGFARQSGGAAVIASQPGKGTTVSIYLPRYTDAPPEPEPAADCGEPAHLRGQECVLLVEDDAAVRAVVREALDGLGYMLHEAPTATAALALMDSGVLCDLLVTDVGLPGIDGRQLADLARLRVPGLQVLFVTGYASQASVRSEFLAEGMDMLAKPFSLETLAAKVRRMLDGRPG